MKKNIRNAQRAVVLALILVLAAPVVSLADHKKHFKEGQKYEDNRQWDKAAESYALAASEKPGNYEYQLYLNRALVQAALMLVERGDRLADQKDFQAAYQTYRQAFAYDQANELALIKARRMLEAMGLPTNDLPSSGDPAGPKNKPQTDSPNNKASYTTTYNGMVLPSGVKRVPAQLPTAPGSKFRKTQVIYRDNNLLTIIEQLSQTIGLNVIFDQQTQNQYKSFKTSFELRDVTYPRALEMVLKAHNLMYMQIDVRTIVVAADNVQSRSRYESFAVRTFYIKNQDAEHVKTAIAGALQSKYITPVKQLNALIVRDTPTNLELIENLIEAIDKAKAEVLVDVQIYEVGRDDLLQIGNQFGNKDNSGNISSPVFGGLGFNGDRSTPRAHQFVNSTVLGFALNLAPSAISLFQSKGKAKLLASTQVHVLDTESQKIRIGRRVPIQTASLPSYTNPTTTGGTGAGNQTGNQNNAFLGGAFGVGIPQIQYENVGLNIDMQPNVYEDEVQLKMSIESSTIDTSTGTLTPSFNTRQMNSVARIRDGQTTMIAGVSQNEESKTVKGLPLIGLIPYLGRFFSTPETINRQSDVVITVTPHILRRADIRETDHLARSAGTQVDPNTQMTIEQIIQIADAAESQKDQVAANSPAVAPPTTPAPTTSQPPSTTAVSNDGSVLTPGVVVSSPGVNTTPPARPNVRREPVSQPGAPAKNNDDDEDDDDEDEDEVDTQNASPTMLSVRSQSLVAAKGQDLYVAVLVDGRSMISSLNFSMNFDPSVIEVKSIRDGGLLRMGGINPDLQFTAEGGLLNVQLTRPAGAAGVSARGQLLLIVFTTKGAGQSPMAINEAQTFVRAPNGQNVALRFQSTEVTVR